MKKSDIINKIHLSLCIYLFVGWTLPPIHSKILLGFIPSIYVNWLLDDNRCILTRLEHYYLNQEKHKKGISKNIEKEYDGFISNIMKKFNINLKEEDIDKLLIFITFHSFIQSYRIVLF